MGNGQKKVALILELQKNKNSVNLENPVTSKDPKEGVFLKTSIES